jgi:hypothetical protein
MTANNCLSFSEKSHVACRLHDFYKRAVHTKFKKGLYNKALDNRVVGAAQSVQ